LYILFILLTTDQQTLNQWLFDFLTLRQITLLFSLSNAIRFTKLSCMTVHVKDSLMMNYQQSDYENLLLKIHSFIYVKILKIQSSSLPFFIVSVALFILVLLLQTTFLIIYSAFLLGWCASKIREFSNKKVLADLSTNR
jgi:hypothetical protein